MEGSDAKRKYDEGEMLEDNSRIEGSEFTQSDTQSDASARDEKPENASNETDSSKKTNKLEKYLEDIYKKHCMLSIDEAEIEFIRNGVERLTLEYFQKSYPSLSCKETTCDVKYFNEIELVKVGSFYEGTRNGFPDEFDFIGVFGTVEGEPNENTILHLRTGICKQCDIYQSNEFPNASIQFIFTYGSRAHGKAERLEFLYKKGSDKMTIEVDVVTAFRCYNTKKYYTGSGIFNQEMYKEILNTGSFLFIYTGSSVTSDTGAVEIPVDDAPCHGPWDKTIIETEKRIVRTVMSEKHRKVYQLLKYIINGPFGEDLFKHLNDVEEFQSLFPSFRTGFSISSYAIKVAVIHHHYGCMNDSNEVGHCVIEILQYFMLAFEQGERCAYIHSLLYLHKFGSFIAGGNFMFLGNFYWCLRAFIYRLMSLEAADSLIKCEHELENSFLEMALRLDIFRNYEKHISHMNERYSDLRVVLRERPKFGNLLKKLTHYNEKRKVIPDCPWCDYPIFIMANKRNV